ncbi:MAG: phage holin family protein [Candidatus Dormibacteria bacterium]
MTVHEAPPGTTRQSVLDVLRGLLTDVVRFGKAEFTLVKAEGAEAAKRSAIGIGLLVGAAIFGLLLVIFLFGAAAEAIGTLLNHQWLGWLIVAGFFLIITVVLALLGIGRVRGAIKEGKEVASIVKEDLSWVKELPKRNGSGS